MAGTSKTEKVELYVPALGELRGGKYLSFEIRARTKKWKCLEAPGEISLFLISVLQAGLEANFAEVQVSVVECPDLTKDPFQFPVKGTTFLMHVRQ